MRTMALHSGKALLLLAAALACATPGYAQDLAPAPGPAAPEIPFTRYELDNGLEVILHEDHSLPIVHVEVWYHVGSKDERPGRSGFAHLFEHLMFNGSKHWDDEYFEPLQPFGAQINGSTSTDRTNYFETVPSHVLERALWLEADRMGFLLPALTQEKLDNQRDVVRNERRQSYEIAPYGDVRRVVAEAVWPKEHPYHHLPIGSHEDLEAATLLDVREFFLTWYVPNNATLCLSGDFDPEQAKAWILKYFGPLHRHAEPEPARAGEVAAPLPHTIELTDDVQLPRIYMVWQSPALFAPGDAELDVLSSVLSDGKSSRLHRRLVFDERIAKDVDAAQYSSELGSTYQVMATVAPGRGVEEVARALKEELGRVAREGISEVELSRAVNDYRKGFFHRVESVAGKAGLLQSYNQQTGDPGYLARDLQRYLDVSREGVQDWAQRILTSGHGITVIVTPARAPEGGTP
jgi:zinc protease